MVFSLFGHYLFHWAVLSEGSKMAQTSSLLEDTHSSFSIQSSKFGPLTQGASA